MTVVTRFAPSPTGFLHIGGARTALFNWLYAKAKGGKFLLRIEDTDKKRSTPEAVDAIFQGLDWLGVTSDDDPVFQSTREDRHKEVAYSLIESGRAYRCYVTPEELTARRDEGDAKRSAAKQAIKDGDEALAATLRAEADELLAPYRSPYRDGATPPSKDAPFVVRLKAPDVGRIEFNDAVQGQVGVEAGAIDDLVLLRSDGSPTYMLAVVVDDHDMGITHAIRGDDHLNNTYRQLPIFDGLGWTPPTYAHVPLIHGHDGKKMSKRHGAEGVEDYRDLGFLPEGMRNYLLRLGWSHGDDEIIPDAQAAQWFDLDGLNKAPARFDLEKLAHINSHYMADADDTKLFESLTLTEGMSDLSEAALERIRVAIPYLKTRSSTILSLKEQTTFLFDLRPIEITGKLRKKMTTESLERMSRLAERFQDLSDWSPDQLDQAMKSFIADEDVGMGQIGPTLRASLTGGAPSPDLNLVLNWLGKEEALKRINDQLISTD